MQIREYQFEASRTCSDLGEENNYTHMRLGVTTEIGEICDIFKKHLAYGKEIDLVHLGEELADVAWYICNHATFTGVLAGVETGMSECVDLEDVLVSLDFIYLQYTELVEDNTYFSHPEQLGMLKTIADYYELDFESLLDKNIAKLKVRFPEKFTQEAALNRNLVAERATLEGK